MKDSRAMRIKFWGVRGSIPTPGPDTVEIGGNTSCVEVRAGNALIIFDGGTGLRLLGQQLAAEMPLTAHVFFSHVHWDHIQGFPFFTPAFIPGTRCIFTAATTSRARSRRHSPGRWITRVFPFISPRWAHE